MLLQSRFGGCLLEWEIALVKSAIFEVVQRVQVDDYKCESLCVWERERGEKQKKSVSTLLLDCVPVATCSLLHQLNALYFWLWAWVLSQHLYCIYIVNGEPHAELATSTAPSLLKLQLNYVGCNQNIAAGLIRFDWQWSGNTSKQRHRCQQVSVYKKSTWHTSF